MESMTEIFEKSFVLREFCKNYEIPNDIYRFTLSIYVLLNSLVFLEFEGSYTTVEENNVGKDLFKQWTRVPLPEGDQTSGTICF